MAHRNLNPYNIYITECHRGKVGNFYSAGDAKDTVTISFGGDHTKGTMNPSYCPLKYRPHEMAFIPEIKCSRGIHIDQFSYGCLILFVFTHRCPIKLPVYNETALELNPQQNELICRKRFVDRVNKETYRNLVEKCLCDDPKERINYSAICERVQVSFESDAKLQDIVLGPEPEAQTRLQGGPIQTHLPENPMPDSEVIQPSFGCTDATNSSHTSMQIYIPYSGSKATCCVQISLILLFLFFILIAMMNIITTARITLFESCQRAYLSCPFCI